MRWPLAGLLAACFTLLWCAHVAAGEAPAVVLRDDMGNLDARQLARSWVDAHGDATLAQVLRAGGAEFQPPGAAGTQRLGPQAALWLHLRLHRGPKEREAWLLKLPMPVLDLATVYQQEGGEWRAESAGDTMAVGRWPERGRYPVFRLELPAGETRDVYVRVQHSTPARFPVELSTAAHHAEAVQLEYLGLGAALGALLLLIAGCAAKGWAYRDGDFAWYAGYAALTSVAIAAYTGVAGQFLWPDFGLLQDSPGNMLACLALGVAVLFVRKTLGLRRRLPWLDRLTLVLGAIAPAVALLGPLAPKPVFYPVMGAYICLAGVVALLASATAWWRGDSVARWVFGAQLPVVSAVLLTVCRNLGWIDLPFLPQSLVVVGLAVEVPLLLVALFIRSRDRHTAEVREQALSTKDALTGLLAPHLFTDRLHHVVARHRRTDEGAAVMYIDLVNHARIREYFGNAVAEQSLLRSVIKLRRLLRDVDTVSRVGEARFGVILEGASARSSVTERATRLVAGGLMPLPGLKPEVTLQFHVAALMLGDFAMEAEEVEQALAAKLAQMSPRTRRPIRFVEPDPSPASDTPDSTMFSEDAPLEPPELAPAP